MRGAVFVGAVQPRQGDAQRAGEHQVDQDRQDRRPRRARPEQRDQQRHAHEAGVGESRHQRAEGRVVPANPLVHAGFHG
jgi:regulator of protease activity HflC (stomatin/prohibitin superfamily)